MIKPTKNLIRHSSAYLFGQSIVMMAGIVTFPIWTRTFSIEEYGILNLINILLAFATGFSKLGLQHTFLRFYPEYLEEEHEEPISFLYTTILFGGLCLGGFVVLVFFTMFKLLGGGLISPKLQHLAIVLAVITYFELIISIFLTFIRSEEKAKKYSLIAIAHRYGHLGASLFMVLIMGKGLSGYFYGLAGANIALVAYLLVSFTRSKKLRLSCISLKLLRESMTYGLPLLGVELSLLLLDAGDRYMIQFFLGSTYVGLYSSAYNLAKYAVSIFASPLRLAIIPLFMRIWEQDGKAHTQQFLSSSLSYYYLIGVPVMFGLAYLGEEILVIFASEKYASAAGIMPIIVTALVLQMGYFIWGAGLYLRKKTFAMLKINLISVFFNILLNLVLIPAMGLIGAALATLTSSCIQIVLLYVVTSKVLRFKIPFRDILRYSFASLLMIAILHNLNTMRGMDTIVSIIIGITTYVVSMLIIDKHLRNVMTVFAKKKLLGQT